MKKDKYNGIAPDLRPKKEKKKDYLDIELASATPIKWKEKKKWKSYTERNQHRTNSCVAQSVSKMLEILNKEETGKTVVFSASPIYAKRYNKPEPGMAMSDVFDILKKHNTTTEKRIKSQMLKSDSEMEKEAEKWNEEDAKIAKTYGIEAYAYIRQPFNIDTIASHLDANRPVLLYIYAEKDEYGEFPVIKYPDLDIQTCYIRHAIVATDFGLINGKKYIRIEDSAHFNKKSVRYIDEDFLKRIYSAGVIFDRKNEWLPPVTRKYTFNRDMVFGEQSEDVKNWQDFLKVQGHFPVVADSTGFYGEITRKATEEFQIKHQVANLYELLIVKGKRVGSKTRQFVNEM